MPYTKRILCLASSDMPGGHCIAGKELLANGNIGKWIRLVNDRAGEGIYSIGECFLTISLTAKPFDDGYAYRLIAAVIKP